METGSHQQWLRAWSAEPLPGDTPQPYTDPLWASAFPSLEWTGLLRGLNEGIFAEGFRTVAG